MTDNTPAEETPFHQLDSCLLRSPCMDRLRLTLMVVSVHPPLVSLSHWVVSSDPMAATVVDEGSVGSGAATAEEASRTATAEARAVGKIIL